MDRTIAWRGAVLAVALALLWRIIAVNAVLYDENGRPRAPQATVRSDVIGALRANPADVWSLLALARADAQSGDPARARAMVAAASSIAPSEQAALEAEASDLLSQGRISEAATRLSKIASAFGRYERIFPVFARMLAIREPSLQRIAAENPRWLGPFILDQCAKQADPLLLAPLLQQRVTPTSGPLPEEVDCVTERLRRAGHWAQAYQAWLNSLPRDRLSSVGFVFNGSFEFAAGGSGFDWKPDRTPERASGHVVEFALSREGRGARALRVSYTGKRQLVPAIVQYLAVAPGRYELSGWSLVDRVNGPRGVQWVVRCAADQTAPVIASSERFLGSNEWRRFGFEVEIPARCPGQVLQLEPVGMNEGTTFLSGNLWFDDLVLVTRH
jgi:hypothetical protein